MNGVPKNVIKAFKAIDEFIDDQIEKNKFDPSDGLTLISMIVGKGINSLRGILKPEEVNKLLKEMAGEK